MYPAHSPVSPTQPPAAYIGGKRRLSSHLAAQIAATPHRLYAEPFVGMGGVFFKRTAAPATEVINDGNGEVANLFRILQRHYPQLMDCLKFQITSRKEFERLKVTDPSTLTDLERAARFLYLQRLAFGGKVRGQNLGINFGGSSRFNVHRLGPVLEDIHERLGGVVIENLDWLDFVERYDRPETLFYLDPPYFGNEDDYGEGRFGRGEFKVMAQRLATIKGRFILSINDRPEIRDLFKAFKLEPVTILYSLRGGKGTPAAELIITGPD